LLLQLLLLLLLLPLSIKTTLSFNSSKSIQNYKNISKTESNNIVSYTIPSPLHVPSLPLPRPAASSSSSSSPSAASSPSSFSSILASAINIRTNPFYTDIINTARIHFKFFGWFILPSSIFPHHQKYSEKVVRLPAFNAPKESKGKIAGEVIQVNLEKIKEFTNEMKAEWYAIVRSVAFIVGIDSADELSIVSDKLLCAPPTKGEQALHY
jgi:hypothetical protein